MNKYLVEEVWWGNVQGVIVYEVMAGSAEEAKEKWECSREDLVIVDEYLDDIDKEDHDLAGVTEATDE